jgi:putative tryptophan/tyrosine transport system substrate-binding protein
MLLSRHTKRREFISLLGGAAATWPVGARAQQAAMPVIGYLYTGAPEAGAPMLAAFRKGLSEFGFFEGRNVEIEYRWANNEPERLPELAADLVHRRVTVIVSPGTASATLAAKASTTTIPIIFRTGGDPIELGLVTSLNRPGGNITGVGAMSAEVGTKRLGILHQLLPNAPRFAALVNPNDVTAQPVIKTLQAAASAIGRQVDLLNASNRHDIDVAFASLIKQRTDALLVAPQGLFINRRVQIVTQAARHAVPAIYTAREFAEIGGLMSYGSNTMEQFRQTGIYTGRVLRGEKPAEMPILLASKFEFVINIQTAKVLDLEIPPTLLALADEVIE